jgi:hypothetical protein
MQKIVYWYLCARDYPNQENERKGLSYPSQATIAKDLDVHEQTVKAAIKGLCEVGYIVKTKYRGANGSFASNVYNLCVVAPDARNLPDQNTE